MRALASVLAVLLLVSSVVRDAAIAKPPDISGTWTNKNGVRVTIKQSGNNLEIDAGKRKLTGAFIDDTNFSLTALFSSAEVSGDNLNDAVRAAIDAKQYHIQVKASILPNGTIRGAEYVPTNIAWKGNALTVFETGAGQYLLKRDIKVRIDSTALDFDARNKRRADAIRAQAIALGKQKTDVEAALLDDKTQAAATAAALTALEPRRDALRTRLADLARVAAKLHDTEVAVAGVSSILDNISGLEAKIDALVAQIAAERKAGHSVASLTQQVAGLQRALTGLDAQLAQKLAGSSVASLQADLTSRLRAAQTEYVAVQDQQSTLATQQSSLSAKLDTEKTQLNGFDTSLMQIAQSLAAVDPLIRALDARAGGALVYHSDAGAAAVSLDDVNKKIAAQEAVISQLKATTQNVRTSFYGAVKDSIASGKRLYAAQETHRWGTFATDLAFDAYDVVKAAESGGIVGAIAEGTKKVVEKQLLPKDETNGIVPGSPEDKINHLYDAGLKDSFGGSSLLTTVENRVIKDTVDKFTKDTVNKYVGSLVYNKIQYQQAFKLNESGLLLSASPDQFKKAEAAIVASYTKLTNLSKGYDLGIRTKSLKIAGKAFKGLGAQVLESAIKDASKAAIKAALDHLQTAAWEDYLDALSMEHGYYAVYYAAANTIEEAQEALDSLNDQKAQILLGIKPQSSLTTALSKAFDSTDTIAITLTLEGKDDPKDPLQLSLGGLPARGGNGSYSIPGTRGAQINPQNNFTITIR